MPRGGPLTRTALEAAWASVAALEAPIKAALVDGLAALAPRGVTIYGDASHTARVGTVAFRVGALPPADVARSLGDAGVCVSAGHFYATLPCAALGLLESGGVVRASIAHYTSPADVDRFLAAVSALLPPL
jgi:selenocysteine lyase/cysteine desulfurase